MGNLMPLSILVATLCIGGLAAVSIRADRRLADSARLPMQWGPLGNVIWTTPRRVALAAVPLLATLVMGLALVRPESGLATPPAMFALATGFVVVQAVYLTRVSRVT